MDAFGRKFCQKKQEIKKYDTNYLVKKIQEA
jgi:hypothetical protein